MLPKARSLLFPPQTLVAGEQPLHGSWLGMGQEPHGCASISGVIPSGMGPRCCGWVGGSGLSTGPLVTDPSGALAEHPCWRGPSPRVFHWHARSPLVSTPRLPAVNMFSSGDCSSWKRFPGGVCGEGTGSIDRGVGNGVWGASRALQPPERSGSSATRLERRELVPRQPHARANNNLWKPFPTRFPAGRPN